MARGEAPSLLFLKIHSDQAQKIRNIDQSTKQIEIGAWETFLQKETGGVHLDTSMRHFYTSQLNNPNSHLRVLF